MFVKPVKGRTVRHPETMRLLNEQGEEVLRTSFWLSCLKVGDVEEAEKPSAKPLLHSVTPPEKPPKSPEKLIPSEQTKKNEV
ncbi:DUF2635 domain-containing protein [Entomobacter blattae]|uniref:DUF2635 domain-containing protein n=1 Tax=Entomobacter blattae TaxID=2762277 RepID=A0A7H1NUI0_9PROT|nr:DUF2635 domain-containing protein [Entomobacter blattae]QNT79440.1 hypothetical protein JGUZn3_22390 [Entomobacter blattae]